MEKEKWIAVKADFMNVRLFLHITCIITIMITPIRAMENKEVVLRPWSNDGVISAQGFAKFLEDSCKAEFPIFIAVRLASSLAHAKAFTEGQRSGWTPLHWAVFKGYTNAVAVLVDGVSMAEKKYKQHNIYNLVRHPTTDKKNTPLHLAAQGNHLKIAIKLLGALSRNNACSLIMLSNAAGQTPLFLAMAEDLRSVFVKYLDESMSDDDLNVFVKNLTAV